MSLAKPEVLFIERRARLARSWPVVGSVCLVVVILFAGWMWVSRPLLINPWAVFNGLEANSIPESTITLMAAMLPILMLACFFVVVVCLMFCFVAFSNERKYLDIIGRLSSAQSPLD